MPADRSERRSPLGLGPLETTIMRVMWETDGWLTVRDIRSRTGYARAGYTTVAKVASILHEKGLLVRRPGDRGGKPGPMAWWYHAARPASEHIGVLIAALLDLSPDPAASLDYALATGRTRIQRR
jgi:Penicillinase repressor